MFSCLVSTALIVLHTGHSVTLGTYLFRVLVYLLAFAGVGVTLFYCVRVVGVVRSTVNGHGGVSENDQ